MADHRDHVSLLIGGEDAAPLDIVPLGEAAAAAGSGRVLSQEHRVATKRRLLSVVPWLRWCEALSDELRRMREDSVHPFGLEVAALAGAEPDPLAEGGTSERGEEIVQVSQLRLGGNGHPAGSR
jgi:hypothetical protein